MKKLSRVVIFLALMSMGLTGCTNDSNKSDCEGDGCKIFTTQPVNLKVACPAGAPAVSLFAHLGEQNVEINAAENVQSYMTDASDKDIVILPTNFGISAIVNKNVSFKIAATVTFGNFYLLSTGLDDNTVLDAGDKVLAFQQNGVAGKLFNYVYGDKELNVTYLADAASVKTAILTSDSSFDYEYALLAQPVVNAVLKNKSAYSLFANVQEDYKTKTSGKEITQASIFVKNTANREAVNTFLQTINNDVHQLMDDTQNIIDQTKKLEEEVVSAKLNGTAQAIKGLLDNGNQLGIGYKEAFANKANIDAFVQTLGLGAISEEIYYRA